MQYNIIQTLSQDGSTRIATYKPFSGSAEVEAADDKAIYEALLSACNDVWSEIIAANHETTHECFKIEQLLKIEKHKGNFWLDTLYGLANRQVDAVRVTCGTYQCYIPVDKSARELFRALKCFANLANVPTGEQPIFETGAKNENEEDLFFEASFVVPRNIKELVSFCDKCNKSALDAPVLDLAAGVIWRAYSGDAIAFRRVSELRVTYHQVDKVEKDAILLKLPSAVKNMGGRTCCIKAFKTNTTGEYYTLLYNDLAECVGSTDAYPARPLRCVNGVMRDVIRDENNARKWAKISIEPKEGVLKSLATSTGAVEADDYITMMKSANNAMKDWAIIYAGRPMNTSYTTSWYCENTSSSFAVQVERKMLQATLKLSRNRTWELYYDNVVSNFWWVVDDMIILTLNKAINDDEISAIQDVFKANERDKKESLPAWFIQSMSRSCNFGDEDEDKHTAQ